MISYGSQGCNSIVFLPSTASFRSAGCRSILNAFNEHNWPPITDRVIGLRTYWSTSYPQFLLLAIRTNKDCLSTKEPFGHFMFESKLCSSKVITKVHKSWCEQFSPNRQKERSICKSSSREAASPSICFCPSSTCQIQARSY